jgi:acetyltransferase
MGTGLNLVGARGVRAGGLALLLQSGNVALSLMTEVTERSWDGVSIYLGVGNQLDVGSDEALAYLEHHDPTRAIIVYLEALPNARTWLRTASRVARTKPIVAVKSGRTAQGSAAALSHTGSVAGPYDRLSAGLRQAGVVEVMRTDELLHVAETLGNQPPCPSGTGIAVLTDGGGQGALAADTITEGGGTLAELALPTRRALAELLGPAAATANPVDLAGASDADPLVFAEATRLLLDDPAVGCLLVVGLFGGYGVRFSETLIQPETEAGGAMARAARSAGKGLVVHTMYAAHRTAPLEALGTHGVPVIGSLEIACRSVLELQRRRVTLGRRIWDADAETNGAAQADASDSDAGRILQTAAASGRSALTESEARAVLAACGLPFPEHREAVSAEEAFEAAATFGGPVVLKLISSTILHKSEAGGVQLGIGTPEEAVTAFREIETEVGAWRSAHGIAPEAVRVMVSPMLPTPRAELLIGGARDPDLGPVLTVGAGGIWVEAVGDVAHRVLPATDEDVLEAVQGLRVGPVLREGRGQPAVATEPILRAARAVARVLALHPEVADVELNPLYVFDDDAQAVDARIILRS